ncbi:MAG: DUF4097 family beta strand repeat-containing protein [Planctomycetota bacterium]|nr:DUF4097 family beta strand repeat-containing protein [Planctomycetota bacterium]
MAHAAPHRPLAALGLLLGACSLGGCVVVGGTLHEQSEVVTLTEAAGSTLVVDSSVGDITLRADPSASEIHAQARMIGKGRSEAEAADALAEIVPTLDSVAGEPGTVRASADHPASSSRRNYQVDWVITGPPGMRVRVQAAVGDILVEGFEGPAEIRADVGDVVARDILNGLTVTADVGDIEARGRAPMDIRVDVGEIDARVLAGPPAPLAFASNVGDVSVRLPGDCVGQLDASVNTGDLSVDLAPAALTATRVTDERFRGVLNAGGPAITLSSNVGDVTVSRAD